MGFFSDDKPLTPKLVGPAQKKTPKKKAPQNNECMGAFLTVVGAVSAIVYGFAEVVS